ncbi:uncharacterized protein TNCV_1940131 [Trichonephila clavipes]|nr:uncharacterized protein TNCV_1940131 [Trichonephila clavipes]
MARIIRHNDESVSEGYIRNGDKEVKLFITYGSPVWGAAAATHMKKIQVIQNKIFRVMTNAPWKHLDDFLRGTIIGQLECGHTKLEVSEEHGIAQSVISRLWQRLQDDGNVSRCYSTGQPRVTPPRTGIYLAVTAKRNRGAQHQSYLVRSL